MPMKDNREYRAMTMTAVERADDDDRMIVEGYATTFGEPYLLYSDEDVEVWEAVEATAFDDADMSDVIMQYDHAGRVFARVKNNTLTVSPDERGLLTMADLSGTDIGRQLYQEIAGGYTDKMSFGFSVAEDRRESVDDKYGKTIMTRYITKISKLYDVSAVSLPANPGTSISARFLDGAIEELKAERQKARELEEKRAAVLARAVAVMERGE